MMWSHSQFALIAYQSAAGFGGPARAPGLFLLACRLSFALAPQSLRVRMLVPLACTQPMCTVNTPMGGVCTRTACARTPSSRSLQSQARSHRASTSRRNPRAAPAPGGRRNGEAMRTSA